MAKGLTPIIGLAVVVALALAAVFGAMSLTNPAFAAVGAPADSQLAEREFHPQDAGAEAAVGETIEVDITSLVEGGGGNLIGMQGSAEIIPAKLVKSVSVVRGFNIIYVQMTGGEAEGDGRVWVTLNLEDGGQQRIRIDVDVVAPTAITKVGETPDVELELRPADDPTTTTIIESNVDGLELDLEGYFMDGRGTGGALMRYEVKSGTKGVVEFATAGNQFTPTTTLAVSKGHIIQLRAHIGAAAGDAALVTVGAYNTKSDGNAIANQTFFVDVNDRVMASQESVDPSFKQSSNDPGDSANYTVRFQFAEGLTVNTRQNDLIIEFHEDYGFPASIRTTSVAVTTTGAPYPTAGGTMTYTRTFTPEDVTVDGEKVLISLGDMDEQDDRFDYEVQGGEVVTVHFRQSAGITNPTEFGGYNLVGIEFGSVEIEYDEDVDPATPEDFETKIVRKISLSDGDGGLGDVITATGKGFKNGTTLTVYRDLLETVYWDNDDDSETEMVGLKPKDKALYSAAIADDSERGNTVGWFPGDDVVINGNLQAPNGELELGEDVLCVVASIGSDDVGRCEFTVTHPTFAGGLNYVNAVDGRDGYDISPADFLLKASITASPAGGSPGETIVIQVVDFPKGRPLTDVEISRQSLECGGCGGSADTTGADNFQIVIPNWVKAGSQELRVTSTLPNGDKVRASTNIDLLGPQINVTPGTVLANQRVSLVGTGFSPGAVIANESDTTPGSVTPELSIGGRVIHGYTYQ